MERLSLLLHSRRWLLLGALALVSLALGSAIFSGATFTSKSANSASLTAASIQLGSSEPSQAIVAAAGMRPGDSRQGEITISNQGTVAGAVTHLVAFFARSRRVSQASKPIWVAIIR